VRKGRDCDGNDVSIARPRLPYPFTFRGGALRQPVSSDDSSGAGLGHERRPLPLRTRLGPLRRPISCATRRPKALKLLSGVAFSVLSIAACGLVARRLTSSSWPLEGAPIVFVTLAGAAYLASFGFRALGWHHLFPERQRPDRARCLAACGTAAASGTVLPFRLDYVVKIAILRRLGGVRVGLEPIVLSIVLLGLIDAAAMLPLAVSAIASSGASFRAPLAVVIAFCVCCVAVLIAGPRIVRLPLIARSARLAVFCARLGSSTKVTRSTAAAALFLVGCWTTRALGSAFLLRAMGVGFSVTIALVVLCMAAAASILPITAGGAVANVGATAGVLLALGTTRDAAINFSLAAGLLLNGAALAAGAAGVAVSVLLTLRRTSRRASEPRRLVVAGRVVPALHASARNV
jgi:hypothetical protein